MHKGFSISRWVMKLTLIVIFASTFLPVQSYAVNPDEVLSDPALEQRARNLSAKLRCLVCQNQSIDDSDASLAKDLRVLLRNRLVSGDSDTQVMDYIVSRYGEFVLLQPRFGVQTFILWSLPVFLILLGAFLAFFKIRKKPAIANAQLSAEEQEKIKKLLTEGD